MITTHPSNNCLRVEIAELIGGCIEICGTLFLDIEDGIVEYPREIRLWIGTLRVTISTADWPRSRAMEEAQQEIPELITLRIAKMAVRDRDIAASRSR